MTHRESDDEQEPYELPEHLTEVVPLAETVLELGEKLDELYEEDDAGEDADDESAGPPEAIVALIRELAKATLGLAGKLEEDEEALLELDEWSEDRELLPRILELPLGLVSVGELDSALAVARAFAYASPEAFSGDIAIIFAEQGKRDEAVAQLEANLNEFPESCLTGIKSGAAFEALGDVAAAEAQYRRALSLAEDDSEEEEAFNLLVGLLEDAERFDEVEALMYPSPTAPQPKSDR